MKASVFLLDINKYYSSAPNNRKTFETIKQTVRPTIVGIKKAAIVHFILPLSFFIVRQAVEQGQCIKLKSMVDKAVIKVHPLATSNPFNSSRVE